MSKEKAKSRSWVNASKGVAIVAVLVVGFLVMGYLKENGPKADKEAPPAVVPVVRVITVKSAPQQLYVETQGRVEPRRRTQAASEVMGRVVMVSPKFKAGGVFSRGEIMLEIDSADYVSALAASESSLADARLLLEQEEARADQARRDWVKLGRGAPSDLVVRKPQIRSAKARITAAEAAVDKATRDLSRTKLRAPYDCRVQRAYTDLGSYVMIGARLAELYSTDAFEVRVPVTLEEMGYLSDDVIGAEVTARASIGNKLRTWKGEIIRSEGVVDNNTMTVYFVMSIKPNDSSPSYSLPPSGLFVEASIKGRVMEDVITIPRDALRSDHTLLTITAENKLRVIPVEVARTLRESVIISGGLKDGTQVIVSPMETPMEGMQLQKAKEDGVKPKT